MKILKTNQTSEIFDKTHIFQTKIEDEKLLTFLNDELSGGEIGRKLMNRSIDVSMINRKRQAIDNHFAEISKRK